MYDVLFPNHLNCIFWGGFIKTIWLQCNKLDVGVVLGAGLGAFVGAGVGVAERVGVGMDIDVGAPVLWM